MTADRELLDRLGPWRDATAVILGVGSVLSGDDAAGPLTCERLAGRVSATVIDGGTAPENHLRPILDARPEVLFVIDAMDFEGDPGQIRLFGPEQTRDFAFGTHALSLHLLLRILRQEREFRVCLIGIQAEHTRLGDNISPAVQAAVETLADIFVQVYRLGPGPSIS